MLLESFSSRYSSSDLYLQLVDGTSLPGWLRYDATKGKVVGLWPVTSQLDSVRVKIRHKRASVHVLLDFVVSDSQCSVEQTVINGLSKSSIKALDYDSQGSLVVLSNTRNFDADGLDILLATFSSKGDLIRALRLGGLRDDSGRALVIDTDGSVWIAGYSERFGLGANDAFLVQLSPSHELITAKVFGAERNDVFQALTLDNQGSIWVVGETYSFGVDERDILLTKFSPKGELIEALRFGGTYTDFGNALAVDSQNTIWLASTVQSFGASGSDLLLVSLTSDANVLRAFRWGGSGNEYIYSLLVDANGKLWVAGSLGSFGAENDDAFWVKFSPEGVLEKAFRWGGSNYDLATASAIDGQGLIWVYGRTYSFSAGDQGNAFVLQLTSAGDVQKAIRLDAFSGDADIAGLVINAQGQVSIAGNELIVQGVEKQFAHQAVNVYTAFSDFIEIA